MRLKNLLLSTLLLISSVASAAETIIDGNLSGVKLSIYGQQVVDLLQGPGVRNSLRNLPVQSVILALDTNQAMPTSRITYFLQLNGRQISGVREVPFIGNRDDFALPPQTDLSNPNNRLELVLQSGPGTVQTARIGFLGFYVANIPPVPPIQPPPPPFGSGEVIRQDLNGQRIHHMGNIDLQSVLFLNSQNGKVLRRVSVVATDVQGLGRVFLSANNQVIGGRQGIFNQPTRINFDLNPGIRLSPNQDIRLNFEGSDIYLDEVAVELEFGSGPIGENRIELDLNTSLIQTDGLLLNDLGVPSRLNHREVESIEIVLNNGYRNLKLQLCKANQSGTPSKDCNSPVFLPTSGPQVARLPGLATATVGNTSLLFSSALDVNRIIIYLR